jgi:hemerythrin
MEWTPDLSVGVAAIDDQHKELIRRMNDFFASMEGDDQKKVLDMLSFLGKYVVTHFRDEEALQTRYRYPAYAEHKKLHEDFIKDVKALTEDITRNGFTFATKALVGSKLTNWLSQHIRKADKAVGEFIRG